MFRKLRGRTPTADQVFMAQRSLDAAYAELEERMAESKKEKGGKVNYGQLTADALNAHTTSPEFWSKRRKYLEWLPDDMLTPAQRKELEELRQEEAAKKP
jgi:hypothetical protein